MTLRTCLEDYSPSPAIGNYVPWLDRAQVRKSMSNDVSTAFIDSSISDQRLIRLFAVIHRRSVSRDMLHAFRQRAQGIDSRRPTAQENFKYR
jgi:hypothetical protein